MSDKKLHFEPYLYLPALTHDAAIIAWGGFYFEYEGELDRNEEWGSDPVEDNKLPKGRKQSIGASSESYGPAQVLLTKVGGGEHVINAEPGANHVVLRDLDPNTEYRYRVFVNGEEWAAGPRRDWIFSKNDEGGLWLQGAGKDRQYDNVFRTFPDPGRPAPPVTFAVLGDFGQGVNEPTEEHGRMCQRAVAEALEQAVNERNVRFILTTGDNIYADRTLWFFTNDEGEEDDDWFFTYFQPYRYIINRVPVFPAIGNHDTSDNEKEADRAQIYDNLYLASPFRQLRAEQEISATENGLFYRFKYGSDIEFFCLDTSRADSDKRYFELANNQAFLDRLLSDPASGKWRIAFSHHPAYCAGPKHYPGLENLRRWMIEHGRPAGVRIFFSGHEHNFQYAQADDAHYFVTGGGGKYRTDGLKEANLQATQTVAWGGNDEGHFLLVSINDGQMTAQPIGSLGSGGWLRQIKVNPPERRFVITL